MIFFSYLLLLALAIFARLEQGNWLAPGAFFALLWWVFVSLPLIFAPEYDIWWGAVLWIFLACFSVYVGSLFGSGVGLFKKLLHAHTQENIRTISFFGLRSLIVFCTILGLICLGLVLHSRGYSIFSLFSIGTVKQMGRDFSIARYHEDYKASIFANFLLSFIYFGSVLGGVLYVMRAQRYSRVLALLPFIPAFLLGIIQTTRTSILYPAVLWIASYFSTRLLIEHGRTKLFMLKRFFVFFLLGICAVGWFLGLAFIRYGVTDRFKAEIQEGEATTLTELGMPRFKVSFLGSVPCFSYWFQDYLGETTTPVLGMFTFAGVYDLFEVSERESGIFQDFVEIDPRGEMSNIFTMFRGLISDFTLAGSLVFLFMCGWIASFSFYQVEKGRILYLPVLVMFYAFALWSYITSIVNYNSIILAFCLFVFYIIINKQINKGKKIDL